MTSAYVIEMSVQPGGARRGHMFVCTTFAHVRKILEWEFAGSVEHRALAADFAAFYGETLGIWIVQANRAVAFLDLHPFLRARIDGAPPIVLDDTAAIEALREKREEEERDFVDEAEWDVDWRGIEKALPALTPPLLEPGSQLEIAAIEVELAETYFDGSELAWGWNDGEGGDDAEPDFPELA